MTECTKDERILKTINDARNLLFDKFGNIVFEEIPHRYTIDGCEYTPVSNIIQKYENHFDAEAISKRKAEREGIDQQELLKQWKWTNRLATVLGSRAHEFGESYTNLMSGHKELICQQNKPQFIEEENWLVPTFPQEFAVKKFYDELPPNIHAVGAEFKLSTQYMENTIPICGTADILFYYDDPNDKKSGFIIGDWKGLDINTPILTTDGWKTMGTVEIGDSVYDKDGNPCKIQHTSEIHHRKCYKITFNNNDTIVADNEHRWLITFGNGDKLEEKVMTSEEIHDYLNGFEGYIPSIKIPKIYNCKPIQNANIELPIDPYVLGCWLGSGSENEPIITNANDKIWEEIENRNYLFGNYSDKGKKQKKQSCTIFGILPRMRELDLINNKHIPSIYLLASYEQRLDLLRGLMDTNGYYDKTRNKYTFHSNQEKQAEAVKTIVSSLGIKVTIIENDGNKIDVTFTSDINPFLNKYTEIKLPTTNQHKYRIITKVEEVETVPTRCIEVDSPTHTFLCGHNFLVTHNTNKELIKDFARNNNKMMLPPFENFYDEPLEHYYLQFNLYQRMMESVGLNVIARRLVHLKNDGTYEVHKVPKIDDNIIDLVIKE